MNLYVHTTEERKQKEIDQIADACQLLKKINLLIDKWITNGKICNFEEERRARKSRKTVPVRSRRNQVLGVMAGRRRKIHRFDEEE